MADSNHEKLDQSNSSMEDSTAMTIEFLRARLLSERSVSKSARQRADELEKRVAELMEQLRIVSLQRKLAEKATVDVLSILERRGISDTSEAFDSGSDHETNEESNEGNDYHNGEERSVGSKRRSELEELSGSDFDSSAVNGGSLSWKGRNNTQRSRERFRDPSMRRRISSIGSSSPRHHLGKSCRQIRRRETRLVVDECKTEVVKIESQDNGVDTHPDGVDTHPEGLPDCSDSAPESLRGGSESVANGRSITSHLDVNGHVQEKDMEKALEDQAQLIGKYEEMEKVQREWEEKFRENNNSPPDSYDPGNHSDVTEEREEVKAQTPSNMGTGILEAEEAKPGKEEVDVSKESPRPQANGFLPSSHVDIEDLKDETSSAVNTVPSRFQAQEFASPAAKEAKERTGNNNLQLPENFHQNNPLLHTPVDNRPSERPSSETGSSYHKGGPLGSQNDLYALVPHNPSPDLGNVLEALKQAKLQLQHKMSRLPLEVSPASIHKPIQPPYSAARIGERAELPVVSTGLFRLPTDFAVEEADSRADFLAYRSTFPMTPYYPSNGVAEASLDRLSTSPYIDRRSSSMISSSRASSSLNSRSEPFFESGLSPVNRYNNYSAHHTYAPSPELMPGIPSNEGFPRTFPSSTEFRSPADRFPFYNDHGRPNNMYR